VAAGWQQPSAPQAEDSIPSLHVTNIQPELYPPAALPLQPEASLPPDTPSWLKYVLAAYRGCVEFAGSKAQTVPQHGDILLMVGSDIPPAAGLSSSSALVVATALALLELWGVAASPQEVAEFTCRWGGQTCGSSAGACMSLDAPACC
jgi:galactokinase